MLLTPMHPTWSALRTSPCVAIARRMRAGVMLAAIASGSVWATDTSAPVRLAPVETARFNPVPVRTVRAEPVPDRVPPRGAPVESLQPPTGTAKQSPSSMTSESVPASFRPPKSVDRPAIKADDRPENKAAPRAATQKPQQSKPQAALAQSRATSPKSTPQLAVSATPSDPAMSRDAGAALTRVMLTNDNGAAPFIIIDKRSARMWLFDAQGQARGSTAVLLGLARGDDTVPGIGDKPLARIRTGERTTPAGRFVAEPGRNARGDDVFWIDYEAAVSLHRVHDVNRGEQRIQRLSTPSAADNRISYGCVNVPTAFYDQTLMPLVSGQRPVVYLLPETRPLDSIFDSSANALASRTARPSGKGSSWRPPTSTVSESSNRSTTL